MTSNQSLALIKIKVLVLLVNLPLLRLERDGLMPKVSAKQDNLLRLSKMIETMMTKINTLTPLKMPIMTSKIQTMMSKKKMTAMMRIIRNKMK